MKIIILTLFFILNRIINTRPYVTVCYNFIHQSDTKINVMFDLNLPFYPLILELKVNITENTYNYPVGQIRVASYFLVMSNQSCSDNFILYIPSTKYPLLMVDIRLLWGGEDPVNIDRYRAVLKPDFEENTIVLDGLLGNSFFAVSFMHDTIIHHTYKFSSTSMLRVNWNYRLRELEYGERFCIELFTRNFSQALFISLSPNEDMPPLHYYKLSVNVIFEDNFMEDQVYLAQVFHCQSSLAYNARLKIYVDPIVKGLRFVFSDINSGYKNFIEYVKTHNRFVIFEESASFNFDQLIIKSKPLMQNMVNRRVGMLLYGYQRLIRYCRVRIPENLDAYVLSRVEVGMVKDIVIYKAFISIDMSYKRKHIFEIKYDEIDHRTISKKCH